MTKPTHKVAAIIVAAGRGARAGGLEDGPKQYRTIGTKAVITHTIEQFIGHAHIDQTVIVHHADDVELLKAATYDLDTAKLSFCVGSDTRQGSVLNGLLQLKSYQPEYVLIHDGVRPFINHGFLSKIITDLDEHGEALLPALPIASTIKQADHSNYIEKTIARDRLFTAQTPQAFPYASILEGHERAASQGLTDFTDDCAIAEWMGSKVKITEGLAENIKLTTREDIAMAHEKLSSKSGAGSLPDIRTGNGYDVHQLVPGDGVILCGIKIPHHKSLSGHSDADAALHALTDALLATCGAGDIGDHFPPSDPQWKGAPSDIFLKEAVRIITDKGGIITNADISIIAEQPKIGPHRQKMRENLSNIMSIELERCSIKATTNEKIGFIGREEGIAAIATATVLYSN